MKKLYFGTNLKMYKTVKETIAYLQELQELTKDIDRKAIELFVIPSYTALSDSTIIRNPEYIKIGAQNMGWEIEGQFTGEISPRMLQEFGTDLVMIGHSERRHVFRETNEEENRKVCCALAHGFTTLLCIGETKQEKEYQITAEVLRTQLKIGCAKVTSDQLNQLMIAYEPVWSIGVNGTPASADYAEVVHRQIKECLTEMFGTAAAAIPVLYGGSVNRENAAQFIVRPSVDGLFVGRSAWQAEAFNCLIREAKESYEQVLHYI